MADHQTPPAVNDDSQRLMAGRITMLLTMLHQFRSHSATLCHILEIDPTAPKREVMQLMVQRIRGLQEQAKKPQRIVYVSGKPKSKPTR